VAFSGDEIIGYRIARHLARLQVTQSLLEIFHGKGSAAAVGVEDDEPLFERALDEEVAGKGDALEAKPDAPADLHVHDRQADRDADAAIEHLVEEAVARIVVIVDVRPKALVFEQE